MNRTHRGCSLIVKKCFSLLCQQTFQTSGNWYAYGRENKQTGAVTWDITTTCEEEEQIMQKVLGYENGVEYTG